MCLIILRAHASVHVHDMVSWRLAPAEHARAASRAASAPPQRTRELSCRETYMGSGNRMCCSWVCNAHLCKNDRKITFDRTQEARQRLSRGRARMAATGPEDHLAPGEGPLPAALRPATLRRDAVPCAYTAHTSEDTAQYSATFQTPTLSRTTCKKNHTDAEKHC